MTKITGDIDMADLREARQILSDALHDFLPATAEALHPDSGIPLTNAEAQAVASLAQLIEDANA
jgi:hypothetical protein